MMPRVLAALVAFVLSVTHQTMTARFGGAVVSVSVPWAIAAAFILAVLVLAVLFVRHLMTFRSSPFPRTAVAT